MSDVRERRDGDDIVRVFGLDAKATSLATAQSDLEVVIDDGLRAGRAALESWRGRHAVTFVEEANGLFRNLSRLVLDVAEAKRTFQAWPDPADPDRYGHGIIQANQLEEPPHREDESAAEPDKLDVFMQWCQAVCERVPSLTSDVNLDGVTAEVTRTVPDYGFPHYVPDLVPDAPYGAGGPVQTEPETETVTTDPASYVEIQDVGGGASTIVTTSGELGPWTGGVAAAFRLGDEQLVDFIMEHPELADELLAGFADGTIAGESALVIMLAYFDTFDSAVTGGTDGEISREDLVRMSCNTDVPLHVRQAAQHLLDSPQMFMLVETMNDDMDTASDIVGNNGDGKMSRDDIETFIEFNDQLAVVDENFDEFDTAAGHGGPDGIVSAGDLEAMAARGGALGVAASWLLDHEGARRRAAFYDESKDYSPRGTLTGSANITDRSLALLATDQQTFADDPDAAAAFVDRRFEILMGERHGHLASPDGMRETFTAALTGGSDQSVALFDRVITEVADDGTIHNSALPGVFAHAVDVHIDHIADRANAPFEEPLGPLTEEGAEQAREAAQAAYDDTVGFLGAIYEDPDAAQQLRQTLFDYGMSQVEAAPGTTMIDAGVEDAAADPETWLARENVMTRVGAVQGMFDQALYEVQRDQAVEDLRESVETGGPGPSAGSTLDYSISHIPYAATVNDLGDWMGVSAGDVVDLVLEPAGVESADEFDQLDQAERADALRRARGLVNRCTWLAADLFDNNPAAAAAATAGQPFVDANGALKTDMTREEREAFREWALATFGGSYDENHIGGGADNTRYGD